MISCIVRSLQEVEINMSQEKPTVAIATTLKSSLEQTVAYIRYNLNIGIDHIFVFFDDPEDPAIGQFADDNRVSEIRCNSEYWAQNIPENLKKFDIRYLVYRQRINATNALKWAREKGIEWITHIDVDELIYTEKRNLKTYLQRTPFHIVRMTLLEVVPDRFEYTNVFTENSLFKKPAAHRLPTALRYPWNSFKLLVAKKIGVRSLFQITGRYFRAHTKSKVLVRTNLDIRDMQIHGPLCGRRHITYRAKRIFLLHFDSCGYQFWINRWKFKLGGAEKPKMSDQEVTVYMSRLMATNPSEERLMDVYRRLHFIDRGDRKKLKLLGLTKEIHLPDNLFL